VLVWILEIFVFDHGLIVDYELSKITPIIDIALRLDESPTIKFGATRVLMRLLEKFTMEK